MEIYLPKRLVNEIQSAAEEAIKERDYTLLRESIINAFSDRQIREINRRHDFLEIQDFIDDIIDDWAGEEVEELFEVLESRFSDIGLELKIGDEAEDEEMLEEDDLSEDEEI
jgi:hypothetical protein